MTEQGLVSIVIPTFNGGERMAETMKSIRNQSWPKLEAIFVDDGSTDETWSVIESMQAEYPFVRGVRLDRNRGAPVARNEGARHANGEFLSFLDDDDYWYENKIEKQVLAAQQDERIGIVTCGMKQIFPELGKTYFSVPRRKELQRHEMLVENYVGATPSVLMRAAAFHDAGGFDNRFKARQDYDLWLRISVNWRIVLIPDILMEVRHDLTRESRISSQLSRYVQSCRLLDEDLRDEIAKRPWHWRRRRKAEQSYFVGSQAIKIGRNFTAAGWFLRSLLYRPSLRSMIGILMAPFGYRVLLQLRSLFSGTR